MRLYARTHTPGLRPATVQAKLEPSGRSCYVPRLPLRPLPDSATGNGPTACTPQQKRAQPAPQSRERERAAGMRVQGRRDIIPGAAQFSSGRAGGTRWKAAATIPARAESRTRAAAPARHVQVRRGQALAVSKLDRGMHLDQIAPYSAPRACIHRAELQGIEQCRPHRGGCARGGLQCVTHKAAGAGGAVYGNHVVICNTPLDYGKRAGAIVGDVNF